MSHRREPISGEIFSPTQSTSAEPAPQEGMTIDQAFGTILREIEALESQVIGVVSGEGVIIRAFNELLKQLSTLAGIEVNLEPLVPARTPHTYEAADVIDTLRAREQEASTLKAQLQELRERDAAREQDSQQLTAQAATLRAREQEASTLKAQLQELRERDAAREQDSQRLKAQAATLDRQKPKNRWVDSAKTALRQVFRRPRE